VVTPGAKRQAVDHLCKAHGVSQRPLPGSGLPSNHERGRVQPCRWIDPQCVTNRNAPMTVICVKKSNWWLKNAVGLAIRWPVGECEAITVRRRIQVMLERKGIFMNITRQVIACNHR